jgi:hypothetical protein
MNSNEIISTESNSVATSDGKYSIGAAFRIWLTSAEGNAALTKLIEDNLPRFIAVLQAITEKLSLDKPPAPGYEQFFVEQGRDIIEAKLLAHAIIHFGKQLADEINDIEKPFGSVMRKLAKVTTSLKICHRAKELQLLIERDAVHHLIAKALSKAQISLTVEEFCNIVGRAVDRDAQACHQLGEHSKAMRAHVPEPRGRRILKGTVAHAFLLLELKLSGNRKIYTYNLRNEDFDDPVTKATRATPGNNAFSPTSAVKLLNSDRFLPEAA